MGQRAAGRGIGQRRHTGDEMREGGGEGSESVFVSSKSRRDQPMPFVVFVRLTSFDSSCPFVLFIRLAIDESDEAFVY